MKKEIKKEILDVCCGGRMFWFNRKNPHALFVDNRTMERQLIWKGKDSRVGEEAWFEVNPDKIMDFRALDLPSNSFSLVVFDPPHIIEDNDKGWMKKKYGALRTSTWRDDIHKGFAECFRVLKPNGVLIFKWSEVDFPVSEILKLTPVQPLFGHISGKAQKTHWICFMKF